MKIILCTAEAFRPIQYFRTAHYPNHPYTYLILDRLGIAAEEEIPVWWFDESQPWIIQNSLRHIHQQMFREMVFKDFNRPSLILWSTCNECKEENNRKAFIKTINEDLDKNYPDGRLITESAASDRPGASDPTQAVCDVAGWTMYWGIFQGTSGQYYNGTLKFIYDAHAANPGKPILNTEFGWWSGETMWNLNGQITAFNETFRALAKAAPISSLGSYNPNGFIMGVTWWCIADWYTAQQANGYQSMGLYTLDRKKLKPVGTALKDAYQSYYNAGGEISTDVRKTEVKTLPEKFRLGQNYPNPFNPSTTIDYSIPAGGNTELCIYDILGNKVVNLVGGYRPAGSYSVHFNASALPSGVYIYELKSGTFSCCKKLALLK
jgi:beta-glucuronidase